MATIDPTYRLFFHSTKLVGGEGEIGAVELYELLEASEPGEDRDGHMARIERISREYLRYSNEDHDVLSSAWSFLKWPMPKGAELRAVAS